MTILDPEKKIMQEVKSLLKVESETETLVKTDTESQSMPAESENEMLVANGTEESIMSAKEERTLYERLLLHARVRRKDPILSLEENYKGPGTLGPAPEGMGVFQSNGFSILHLVLFEQYEVVEMLLLRDEEIEYSKLLMERTSQGWLALHLCTFHTDVRVVELLLQAYQNKYGHLHRLAPTLLQRFLSQFHDKKGMTPLHYASWASNYQVVGKLLRKPFLGTITYVHSVDFFLLTPLHICAFVTSALTSAPLSGKREKIKDTEQTVKLLIQAADDASKAGDADKQQPKASEAGYAEKEQPKASEAADHEGDQWMLDICINALDCCSYTPLHWTARSLSGNLKNGDFRFQRKTSSYLTIFYKIDITIFFT